MKHIKLIISSLILLIVLSACDKELLDKYPLDEISSGDFFKQVNDLEIYMNQFYTWEILKYSNLSDGYDRGIYMFDYGTDNTISQSSVSDRLQGVRTVPSNNGDWDYSNIRSVNYFFDNYERCEEDFKEYQQYVGEAYFFRALLYFQMMQKFGDVVWYDHMLDTESEELYAPRTPRNEVADNILADLDSAAIYLSESKIYSSLRVNKWIALGLQSRVALYEGSWEKYHEGSAFGVAGSNPEKYFTKAVEAAEAVMASGKYGIYSKGDAENDYYNLFILKDYTSVGEIMFWKKFDKSLEVTNYRMITGLYPAGIGITRELADAFLCTDGSPISVSPLFVGYDTIANEMANRDPRFYQSIWTPESAWKLEEGVTTLWGTAIYSNLYNSSKFSTPTGYVMRKGYNFDITTHDLAGEDGPAHFLRYAEVLLNFAEARAELGSITQSDLDRSIKLIRDRVAMPNMDLANIASDPNWDFPDLSPVINEIRRERRVELNNEGFRWSDIARWAAADELIVGQRPSGFLIGDQFPKNKFPQDNEGFLDPYQAKLPDGYGFDLGRDYLDPMPVSQITLNPKLGQNPGWTQ